jgi:hypothetical protein
LDNKNNTEGRAAHLIQPNKREQQDGQGPE